MLFIIPIVFVVDGRPVLLFQRRIGRNGREIIVPKIRTLKNNIHPNKPACVKEIEVFMTKTGGFLRRHRLDELPQIFSILAGQMSLVGPRPELTDIVNCYTAREMKRLCARPGLTGFWQIKGPRNQPIHENIKYDIYYLRKANLWFDIKILIGTAPFVLKGGE